MKKALFSLIVPLLIMGGNAMAQSVLPTPGLTPASPFYFIDRFGEWLEEALTFKSESKIKLQMEFAAERVAEIKILLEIRGVEAKGLEVAQSRLQEHVAKATGIIEWEKQAGKEVADLAGSVVDDFRIQKKEIKDAFKKAKDEYSTKKEQLREELRLVVQKKDSEAEEHINQELSDIEAAKDEAESQKEAALIIFETERKNLLDDLRGEDLIKEEKSEIAEKELEKAEKAEERQIEIEAKQLEKGVIKTDKAEQSDKDLDKELKAQEEKLTEEEGMIDDILKLVE